MTFDETLKAWLKKNLSRYVKPISFECEVLTVDASKDTCKVRPVEGPELEDVRLRSVQNAESHDTFVVYPRVGSFVMVSRILNLDEFYVSAVDEFDSIKINGGELGGLVKIQELVSKLNNLESLVNSIRTNFNAHSHPATSGTTSPTASQITDPALQQTTVSDLEDPKVKH